MNDRSPRDVVRDLYAHPMIKEVTDAAAAREGAKCLLRDDPINGVFVAREEPNYPETGECIVELTADEVRTLLQAVGKAFSEISRMQFCKPEQG